MSSAEAQRVGSLVGQVIDGRYRVDSVLAIGGMGAVLRGTHLVLGQAVAIKVMLDATMRDPTMRERVFREARILAQVRSPAIASIFDAGLLPDGTLYIVMELLEGEELEAAIVRRSLSLPQAARLLAQVCEGLADAHAQGIVHRDLKPANIFLVRKLSGEIASKIIDFGISKRVGEMSETTTVTTIIGSPYYMAPEQASSSRDVDHRADIWSLGVILYRIVVGRFPFEGTISAILAAIRSTPPVFPPSMDPAFKGIIMRCLEKDLSRRYESALELRAALLPLAEVGRGGRESLTSWPPPAPPQADGALGRSAERPVVAPARPAFEESPGTERTKVLLDLASTGASSASAPAPGGHTPYVDDGEMVTTKMTPAMVTAFQAHGRGAPAHANANANANAEAVPGMVPQPMARQAFPQTAPHGAPMGRPPSSRPLPQLTAPPAARRWPIVVWVVVAIAGLLALGAIALHVMGGAHDAPPVPAARPG